MNKVFLIGNLTKNPELSTTGSGISVCKFTLAVSRRFSNKDGVRDTDFLPVIVWREQADHCNKYLKKGSKAAVSGSIQTRTYDAEGGRRYITEIIADEVQFLTTKNDSDSADLSDGEVFDDLKVVDADLPF
jgi:single-strand DNA-binding protein